MIASRNTHESLVRTPMSPPTLSIQQVDVILKTGTLTAFLGCREGHQLEAKLTPYNCGVSRGPRAREDVPAGLFALVSSGTIHLDSAGVFRRHMVEKKPLDTERGIGEYGPTRHHWS